MEEKREQREARVDLGVDVEGLDLLCEATEAAGACLEAAVAAAEAARAVLALADALEAPRCTVVATRSDEPGGD